MSKHTESGIIEGILTEGQSLQHTTKSINIAEKNIERKMVEFIESSIDFRDITSTLVNELKSLPILKGKVKDADAYHSTRDAIFYKSGTYSIPVKVELKLKQPIDVKNVRGIMLPNIEILSPNIKGNYLEFNCLLKFKINR